MKPSLVALLFTLLCASASQAQSPPLEPLRRGMPHGRPLLAEVQNAVRPAAPPHLPAMPALPNRGATRPLLDIHVAVVGSESDDDVVRAVEGLSRLGFSTKVMAPHLVEKLEGTDVLYLPSGWYEDKKQADLLDEMKTSLDRFFQRGGGLVAGQPNPYGHPGEECTPHLLPYPIRFHNWYVMADARRKNLDPSHFITEDVPAEALPYPADRMLEVDGRYQPLARGEGSQTPSVVIAEPGKGRVVVHTSSTGGLHGELLRRMVVWAAQAEPARSSTQVP